jgi:hypothetical protein
VIEAQHRSGALVVPILRHLTVYKQEEEGEVSMKDVMQRYGIGSIWHFTDRENLKLIETYGGLLSVAELGKRGIQVPLPGGNQWSHDADRLNGVHTFVHLSFVSDHPMLFVARQEGRIKDPVWLEIDASLILQEGTRFTSDVANKSGVQLLTPDEAAAAVDFEVLFTRTDWRSPEIQTRLKAARKCEVLVPTIVPIDKILRAKNG